jgi:DNA repair protein RecO (recombination protein O)
MVKLGQAVVKMALYKTKGIVLKSVKLGEADRIVTFLSNSKGKIRAVAKGVRRTTSKFGARLELFSYVDLLLYKGRELDIVTQAEVIRSFQEIREDLNRLTFGSGMLDLTEKISLEGQSERTLFDLLLRGLTALTKAKKNFRLLLSLYDLKLMAIAGYSPKLEYCAVCEKKPGKKLGFSYEWGGIVCQSCFKAVREFIDISFSTYQILKSLYDQPLSKVENVNLPSEVEQELFNLANDYVIFYTQVKLRSHAYLDAVSKQKFS